MAFLYANEKYTEKKIIELSLLIVHTQTHAHSHKHTPLHRFKPSQENKRSPNKNFKTPKKEIKIQQKIKKKFPMLMGWKYQSHKNGHHI